MIGVCVPAHDEQELLPAALAAVRLAAAHPALHGVPVRVVTVLDACTDESALHVEEALVVDARNVGVARAAGFAHLLAQGASWLATTDADTVVPPDWLAVQWGLHLAGADAVAGTVRVVDWAEQPPLVAQRFAGTYGTPVAGHLHVHGANLGVARAAYLAVGGVPALAVGEDQVLVDRLRAAGFRVEATGAIPVTTSARRRGRAAGGFADHLGDLAEA